MLDDRLVQEFFSFNLPVVYAEFVEIWVNAAYPPHCDETRIWQQILSRIRQFANTLPPAADLDPDSDFATCLFSVRRKLIFRLSESKEQSLNAKIDLVQSEKKELEDRVRQYDRAISDLGFRHLIEKLPVCAESKGGTSTDRWKNFWEGAWNHNGEGPKHGSPLRTLWINSDSRTRKSITEAGARLFNVLSDNIHGFGRAYDPQDAQRDKSQGDILKGLQTAAGEHDWP